MKTVLAQVGEPNPQGRYSHKNTTNSKGHALPIFAWALVLNRGNYPHLLGGAENGCHSGFFKDHVLPYASLFLPIIAFLTLVLTARGKKTWKSIRREGDGLFQCLKWIWDSLTIWGKSLLVVAFVGVLLALADIGHNIESGT